MKEKIEGVILMNVSTRLERQKQIDFAVGLAALDGGKPTSFTKELLCEYEKGEVTSKELKQAILQKYFRKSK